MKIHFSSSFYSFAAFALFTAQRFAVVSAELDGGIIQVDGEVFIDVAKKSIA